MEQAGGLMRQAYRDALLEYLTLTELREDVRQNSADEDLKELVSGARGYAKELLIKELKERFES